MSKLKIGEQVLPTDPGSEQRVLTISGRETHKHYEFYRVRELPGALFLSSSLSRVKGGFITPKPHGPSPEVAPMRTVAGSVHVCTFEPVPAVAPRESQGETWGQIDEIVSEWGAPKYVMTDDGEAWYWCFPGHELPVADDLSELFRAARDLQKRGGR